MSNTTVDFDGSKRFQIGWQHYFVIAMGLAFLPSRFDIEYSIIFEYEIHKTLHILGVIMLVGNILLSLIWMFLANRTKNNEVTLFASKSTDWLDRILTAPGIALIVFNGLMMADSSLGGPFNLNWMISAIFRLLIVAIIWVLALVPNQRVMIKAAQEAVNNDTDLSETFDSAYKKWRIWTVIIIILLVNIVEIMVSKPDLDFS